jgi:bifunctional non-homologous end joining protein LigD
VPESGVAFFEAAKAQRLEGIIAKKTSSRYLPGRRTSDWRKIKILNRQDCVILGWTPGQGGRGSTFGALLVGAYRDGKLMWIGQVGTGFTDQTLAQLMARLDEVAADAPAIDDPQLTRSKGARWTRPELVCEVEFLQITGAGKLRAPSFKGLRPDKLPEDCVLETPAGTASA